MNKFNVGDVVSAVGHDHRHTGTVEQVLDEGSEVIVRWGPDDMCVEHTRDLRLENP